jgi:DNA-binding response OmpR family regulator
MNRTKILIVDDDRNLSGMAKLFLEKIAHYQVEVVNDSRLAIAKARAFRPDAMLLDVQMPGIDGGDLAAELRADSLLGHIPMMFFTGLLAQSEAGGHEVMRGGIRYLAKPLNPKVLMNALTRLLSSAPVPS